MAKFVTSAFCSQCDKELPIFKFLTDEELEILNEQRYEVTFNPGEIIFKQGGALTHVACINSGFAKIYLEGLHGKNLFLKILKPADLITGPGVFVDYRNHYSVAAINTVSACFIKIESFLEVIKSNTEFALSILKWVNGQRIVSLERLMNLTQKHMPGRIADALKYLSESVYESTKFSTDISRQDLADLSSMSKESAIRILKEFKDSGLIRVNGNTFEILKPELLRKISENG